MPLIEELPVTQTHRATHGWAYVPVADPSIPAPIAATLPGNRKRNRDGTLAATATAKQQKALQARLDSLDKENYRDGVAIPIPAREKGKREAGTGKKMTPNVRRILTSQRAFAHYLADEEASAGTGANSSVGGSNVAVQATVQPQAQSSTKPDGRKRESVTGTRRGRPSNAERERRQKDKENEKTMQPPPTPKPTIKQEEDGGQSADQDTDTVMTDAPTSTPIPKPATTPTASNPATATTPVPSLVPKPPTYDSKLDTNPLLRTTGLPKMPSDRVMAVLLAEPPLSYAAARAKLSAADEERAKPVRRFCGVCGYWGKVKCRKCGEWNCGIMECWKGHEGVCVAKGVY